VGGVFFFFLVVCLFSAPKMLVSRAGFVFGRLVAGAEKSAMTRAASQKMWMATAEVSELDRGDGC